MRKQGLLFICLNLFLLALLISTLPLPQGLISKIFDMPRSESSIKAQTLNAGGIVAREYLAVNLPGPIRGDSRVSTDSQPEETCKYIDWDIVCERYPVYGDTKEELQRAVTCLENGTGPLEEKEGKRYAAYVTADYKVDYSPEFIGRTDSDGEVAIELGARTDVRREIHLTLPDFRPSDPSLEADCDAEEARLLAHECQHIEVYRMCGKSLEDSLKGLRVVGHGPNASSALTSAKKELDRIVQENLTETVNAANEMNDMVDLMTNHGLGIG
jgi:predicted secreted Zn-dependent protease